MAMSERYYEDGNRLRAHESQLEHRNYFTFEQVHDICSLLKEGQWPDGRYSDDECNLWSLIQRELDIEV